MGTLNVHVVSNCTSSGLTWNCCLLHFINSLRCLCLMSVKVVLEFSQNSLTCSSNALHSSAMLDTGNTAEMHRVVLGYSYTTYSEQ